MNENEPRPNLTMEDLIPGMAYVGQLIREGKIPNSLSQQEQYEVAIQVAKSELERVTAEIQEKSKSALPLYKDQLKNIESAIEALEKLKTSKEQTDNITHRD